MNRKIPLLFVAHITLVTAGCDRVKLAEQPVLEFADKAITVRQLDSNGSEMRFEIVATSLGMLTASMGPSAGMATFVESVPETFVLSVAWDEMQGDSVIRGFITPLYGAGTAERLESEHPDAASTRLRLATMSLDTPARGSFARTGPFLTPLPFPRGGSTTSGLRPGSVDESHVRLGAWLDVPRPSPDITSLGLGIAPDGPHITYQGRDMTVEEAGALFTELTLEFDPERLAPPSPR